MSTKIAWYLVVITAVIFSLAGWFGNSYLNKTTTSIAAKDTTVELNIGDTVKPKFLIIKSVKHDTVSLTQLQKDSIYQVAKEYWSKKDTAKCGTTNYVASCDTTYIEKDNDDTTLIAHVFAISRIPLDPNLFFILHFTLTPKITTVTKTEITMPENWFSRTFGYGLNAGIGYGVLSKKMDAYIGFGLQIKLGNLF